MPQTGRSRGRPRAFNDQGERAVIQSLDRAMTVLRTVAAGDGMSLTEVAEASDQPASTVYRILITLQKHAIVAFDEADQTWHVGLGAFRIGSAFLGRTSIVEQSRTAMQSIMSATGETANLAIADRNEVVFVSQVESQEPIRAFFRPGTRGPIHASGIGKALLAYLPAATIDAIAGNAPLTRFTDKTITGHDELVAELNTIRRRGWAVDDEERTDGMRCIAAPIFNAFGEAIAGISVSGPSVRLSADHDARNGALVRQAAADVTRAIGGKSPTSVSPMPPANDA